jgi:hypothetical protein
VLPGTIVQGTAADFVRVRSSRNAPTQAPFVASK